MKRKIWFFGILMTVIVLFAVTVGAVDGAVVQLEIKPVDGYVFRYDDTGVTTEQILVMAQLSDGSVVQVDKYTLHGIFSGTSPENAIEKAQSGMVAKDFADHAAGESVYVLVEYDGVFAAMDALAVFDFQNPVPIKVEIGTVDGVSLGTYIDGQILGDKGFDNVEIRITYDCFESPVIYANDNGIGDDISGIKELPGKLTCNPFVYGYDKITFSYTENNTKIKGEFSCVALGIVVEKKQVVSLEIAQKTSVKVSYTAGEKLNLDGLTLKVTYNNGLTEEISYANPAITYNPKQNDALTEDIDNVLFVYSYTDSDGNEQERSCQLPITVSKATTSTSSIKEVTLISTAEAKIDYFIGESFDPDGFMILVIYNGDKSSEIIDLGDCSNVSVTKPVTKYSGGKFIEKMDEGTLTVTFNLPTSITNLASERGRTITIDGISATKRPVLESVTVSSSKDIYMEGDSPRVVDFKYIAKYDDGTTRVFEPNKDDSNTEKTSYITTIDNITYTIKLTPTTIEADTKNIRVSYAEKVSGQTTKTVYVDYPIEEVIVPDAILRYYDVDERSYLTKAYDDFYDALEDAEAIMDSYPSTYASRIPEIQMRKDITMLSNFTTTESINIEMNGHTLTMIRGTISVSSRAASGTEVCFMNSNGNAAMIVYAENESVTVVIPYHSAYVIGKDNAYLNKNNINIAGYPTHEYNGVTYLTAKSKKNNAMLAIANVLRSLGNVEITSSKGQPIYSDAYVGTGSVVLVKNTAGNVLYAFVVLIPGDIDGNGVVTAMDRVILSRYFTGQYEALTASQTQALDLNKDGSLTAKDRMILSRHVAGWAEYKEISILDDVEEEPVEPDVGNGFNGEPYCDLSNERVYFYPTDDGEVYYYFSPATSAYNETVDEFWDSYISHSETGRISVTDTLQYIDFDGISSSYRGVMLMFVDAADREHYPVYVSIMKDTSSGDGSNMSGTGLTNTRYDSETYTFSGYAIANGTLSLYVNGLVDENNPGSSLASIAVTRYEAFVLEIPEIIKNLMGSSFGANILSDAYVQRTTDSGDVYEKFPLNLGQ